ncbi:hydroxylamine reductase [Lachnospira pectinoschiza]|uniref:hydroxylamine reductase n=1 Tax=Lachnospira pectinoschiza TaxID=28052 RepID=UPI001D082A27|nr:hydroxylamine reductase [Lachnospira pectinoschiza]MCB6142199.1 hydroxylamine reductase [Lachnospira pectinoschiza]
MSNNMDLGYEMFCYQCEQTANGKGCTKMGVCGKTPEIANLQDLLIYQAKGICCYAKKLLETGEHAPKEVVRFLENVLFTTLTNVNFDADVHVELLKVSQNIKEELREQTEAEINRPAAVYNLPETKSEMLKDAPMAGIMYDKELDEDIRSLRQTILYGLKGISAYGHQARELGYYRTQVDDFYIYGLEALTDDALTVEELIRMTMRTGEMALEVMKQLDEANTSVYGNPYPHKVSVRRKKGPFIIVSGHDFKDLEMLLEQTKDTGINIYTHGEMLPGHGYEGLKKYPHLVGNFGGAWQDQQKEFDNLPGCILMTTNCLMRPREGYKDRIYSTNVVGWEGVKYIPKKENGEKDFHEIIEQALALGGFSDDEEEKEITVGFAHQAVLTCAEKIVEAVKDGTIRHFFLIGGCDGARPGRNYYTEFAKMVPQDCVILTLACGKYRFNKLDFGEIAGLPRLMDVGQCNDVYSAVRIATALADAFNTDVNGLPLSMIVSWYEQKAVADLLALLSLGVRNIYLGPTLPAFLSPNVLQYLVDTFHIRAISNAEDDIKTCLKQNIA